MFRSQTRLDSVGTVLFLRIATAALGKESPCVTKHPYTAHAMHSVVLWLQTTYTFHTL